MTEHKLICPWCGDCRRVRTLSPTETGKTIRALCAHCTTTRNADQQREYDFANQNAAHWRHK